jgi:Na+/proline symporter
MKLPRVFAILLIILLIYMIYREITTSYTYKNSSEIFFPAIIFFIFLVLGLYFKKKEKIVEKEHKNET